jgi:hypothetical protein
MAALSKTTPLKEPDVGVEPPLTLALRWHSSDSCWGYQSTVFLDDSILYT